MTDWRFLWVMVALALSASVASAQTPMTPVVEFTSTGLAGRLMPEIANAEFAARFAFSCSVPELKMGMFSNVVVSFTLGEMPMYSQSTMSPGIFVASPSPPNECVDGSIRHEGNVSVVMTLTRNAPAFLEHRIPLEATMSYSFPDGQEETHGPYVTNLTFAPDYIAIAEANPAHYVVMVSGPDEIARFPLELQNFANGETRMSFENRNESGVEVSLPNATVLSSPDAEPVTTTIFASIPPEAYEPNKIFSFTVQVLYRSTESSANSTGETAITFSIRTSPTGGLAPGPMPLVVLGVVAWIAVGRRRALL